MTKRGLESSASTVAVSKADIRVSIRVLCDRLDLRILLAAVTLA